MAIHPAGAFHRRAHMSVSAVNGLGFRDYVEDFSKLQRGTPMSTASGPLIRLNLTIAPMVFICGRVEGPKRPNTHIMGMLLWPTFFCSYIGPKYPM